MMTVTPEGCEQALGLICHLTPAALDHQQLMSAVMTTEAFSKQDGYPCLQK